MSSPEYKVHNNTAMPISVGIWLYPVSSLSVKPSWYQVIKPEAKHHFSHCVLGSRYEVHSLVSPDAMAHPEWNWIWPGFAEFMGLIEEGFKMWHDGELDLTEMYALAEGGNEIYSSATCSSHIKPPEFNQTINVQLDGSVYVDTVDVDKKIYKTIRADTLISSD
jgi:hypothetical protein|tara:strand:+ start:572 stop:1063 length:492 start_codon:yes stop_codon:yes gene_type:complete